MYVYVYKYIHTYIYIYIHIYVYIYIILVILNPGGFHDCATVGFLYDQLNMYNFICGWMKIGGRADNVPPLVPSQSIACSVPAQLVIPF